MIKEHKELFYLMLNTRIEEPDLYWNSNKYNSFKSKSLNVS